MFGIGQYMLAGSIAIALAGGGYGFIQKQKTSIAEANLNTTKAELSASKGHLMTCSARLQNILNDVESDNEIDNLADDQLTIVPEHWLRP